MRKKFGVIKIDGWKKPIWVDVIRKREEVFFRFEFNEKIGDPFLSEDIRMYAHELGFHSRYIYSRYGSYVKFYMYLPQASAQEYLDSLIHVTQLFRNDYEKNFDFKQEKSLDWVMSEKMFTDWLQGEGE